MTPRDRAFARLDAMSPIRGLSAFVTALVAALVEAEELRSEVERLRSLVDSQ
jgi:hypothetical protein